MIDAVRASIALPGIISPVKRDGRWLLDGGLTNPVPVSACRARGAEIIIAVNPNANVLGPHARQNIVKPQNRSAMLSLDVFDQLFDSVPNGFKESLKTITPSFLGSQNGAPNYFDVLSASIDIMISQILRSRLAGEPPHVMINPHLSHLSVLEFNRAEEAIEEGRKSAKRAMAVLREYLP
jgi:NTE family protein